MINKIIKHNSPTLDSKELIAAKEVIESGWLSQGKEVTDFENKFCEYHGLENGYAVAVSSGTAALFLALWALDVKSQTVDLPSYSCTALENAIYWAGAIPQYIDNDYQSPNINIDLINKSKSNFAIIQHTYGIPVDINKIKNKVIIEDCCQAIGAKINDTKVGLFGKISIFSFYATKLITSGGQGGMVLSKDKSIIDKIRDFINFDQKNDKIVRFNFQMTNLQAAIGKVQLSKLNSFILRREMIFSKYLNTGISLLSSSDFNIFPVRYRAILLNDKSNHIISKLDEFGIKCINPFRTDEILGAVDFNSNVYSLSSITVSLPIYPSLSDEELNFILEKLNILL